MYGIFSLSPYTAQLDMKMNLLTPEFFASISRLRVPLTFAWWHMSGCSIEYWILGIAAKCIMASAPLIIFASFSFMSFL